MKLFSGDSNNRVLAAQTPEPRQTPCQAPTCRDNFRRPCQLWSHNQLAHLFRYKKPFMIMGQGVNKLGNKMSAYFLHRIE